VKLKIASFDLRQLRGAGRCQDGEAANGSLHKLGMDYLYAALHVTAFRYAAEKRYLAESIAELRRDRTPISPAADLMAPRTGEAL
jgi:hypothetical protein